MPKGLSENDSQMMFRIDAETKEAFIQKAKKNNTNATRLLLAFIDSYLADEIPINITERKGDIALARELGDLKERMSKLEQVLGKLAA